MSKRELTVLLAAASSDLGEPDRIALARERGANDRPPASDTGQHPYPKQVLFGERQNATAPITSAV